MSKPRSVANMRDVPGWEGSAGPVTREAYGKPHVFARDVQSGSGNCVCGMSDEDDIHVPVPMSPRGTWRQKDVYGSMAPMSYVRGLGASPSRPRQSPPPTIVARAHAPALRGQIRRLRRRSRQGGAKTLVGARERLEAKQELSDGVREILRVAAGWDEPRDLTGMKAAWDRLDTKGAPSRMPPHLISWWAGPGRSRWAGSPTPWRTLRTQLRAHGVPGRMVDGATSNVWHRAYGYWPSERRRSGKKSLENALVRL